MEMYTLTASSKFHFNAKKHNIRIIGEGGRSSGKIHIAGGASDMVTGKIKRAQTAVAICLFLSMFYSWFGNWRGVQDIRGVTVLGWPMIIGLGIVIILGIGNTGKGYLLGRYISVLGLSILSLVELYNFLVWDFADVHLGSVLQLLTKDNIISRLDKTYVGFYISLLLTVILLLLFVLGDCAKSKAKAVSEECYVIN